MDTFQAFPHQREDFHDFHQVQAEHQSGLTKAKTRLVKEMYPKGLATLQNLKKVKSIEE